jgi:hypothetical protein
VLINQGRIQFDPTTVNSTLTISAQGAGSRFRNGPPGGPGLRIAVASPADSVVTTAAATVKAPGPPGSIEKGVEEPRGYVLRAVAPAARTFRFEVRLDVVEHF